MKLVYGNNLYSPQDCKSCGADSSSDFKFSSGTTFPELEIIGSYTGSGIVFGKPSYNIRDYINTFVFNAQFGGGPTAENGGFINNAVDFTAFMKNQAATNPVEVAAFGLKDGKYYVQPWNNGYNNASRSKNNFDAIPGYKRSDVINQHHSHPDPSGPSIYDARASQTWQIPVNVYNINGEHWEVAPTSRDYIIPINLPGMYYGIKH